MPFDKKSTRGLGGGKTVHAIDPEAVPGPRGGLSPKKMAGTAQSGGAAGLTSNVSGHKFAGRPPSGGPGGKSPTAAKIGKQAAKAGRIATSGQARGGPQSQGGESNQPSSGLG